jgi:hypothetical protein
MITKEKQNSLTYEEVVKVTPLCTRAEAESILQGTYSINGIVNRRNTMYKGYVYVIGVHITDVPELTVYDPKIGDYRKAPSNQKYLFSVKKLEELRDKRLQELEQERSLPTADELRDKLGDAVGIHEARKILGIGLKFLDSAVTADYESEERGLKKAGFYYKSGEDYVAFRGSNNEFLFLVDKLKEIRTEYKKVSELFDSVNEFNYSRDRFYEMFRQYEDFFSESVLFKTENGMDANNTLYHEKTVIELIRQKQEEFQNNYVELISRGMGKPDMDKLVHPSVISVIDRFINHMQSASPQIIVSSDVVFDDQWTSEEAAEQRKVLLNLAAKITAGRCGILHEDLYKKIGSARMLAPNETALKEWKIDSFDSWLNIDIEDFNYVIKDIKSYSFWNQKRLLKKFFHFLLMQEEKQNKIQKKKIRSDILGKPVVGLTSEELLQLVLKTQQLVLLDSEYEDSFSHLKSLMHQIPGEVWSGKSSSSVFLTVLEYIQVCVAIWDELGLDYLLRWLLCSKAGLRASEALVIAVEDWVHDPVTGLPMRFEGPNGTHGWGKIKIPDVKSKGGYGPSHESEDLPLPPDVTDLYEEYLINILFPLCPFEKHKELQDGMYTNGYVKNGVFYFQKKVKENGKYMIKEHAYKHGHGYIFRPKDHLRNGWKQEDTSEICHPLRCYSNHTALTSFISDIRTTFDFLPKEKRNNLSFHDGRHTLNQWIETATYLPFPESALEEVADIAMRHDIRRNNLDTGKKSYRDTNQGFIVQSEDVLRILYGTIGFNSLDRDYSAFKAWAAETGYPTNLLQAEELKRVKEAKALEEQKQKLKKLKENREMLDLEKQTWVDELDELETKLKQSINPPKGSSKEEFDDWRNTRMKVIERVDRLRLILDLPPYNVSGLA